MNFEDILDKLKPEHASVITETLTKARNDAAVAEKNLADRDAELAAANDALAKANAELETLKAKSEHCECDGEADDNGVCASCGKPKKSANFDETETLKSLPENVRVLLAKERAKREAAEELLRKNEAEKIEAEAIAKAAGLKAIPVSQERLVGVLKSCDPAVFEILQAANKAIEDSTLTELGKNRGNGAASGASDSDVAWAQIEKKATEIAKRDSVTSEKAIAIAIEENPDLYRQYLEGGAN